MIRMSHSVKYTHIYPNSSKLNIQAHPREDIMNSVVTPHQQLFIKNNNPPMELNHMNAATPEKDRLSLASYRTLKVFRNGDFLAKNQFADIFLLSVANRPKGEPYPYLQESNIIQAVQSIVDHSQNYEIFPFDNRMIWAQELVTRNRSEIYCVTLVNSAIKHVIRPLKDSNMAHPEQYINISNICIRDNSLFLFMKNKGNVKALMKTENVRQHKRFYKMNQASNSNEDALIRKFGEIFWNIFYQKDEDTSSKRQTFREIIISMRKGELTLEQLENIMNDKRAIKRFMSSKKKNSIKTSRRMLFDPNEQNQNNKQTIQSIYERLGNIPIRMGRPMNGMLFSTDKKYKAQTISTDPKERRQDKTILFSSIDSDVPPSFSKGRRFKKMSIFSDSRNGSRRHSQSNRYDNINQKSHDKNGSKRYEDFNFSFEKKEITPSKYFNPHINSLNVKRKSVRIRDIFNELAQKQSIFDYKLQKNHAKSKEKAEKIKSILSIQKQVTQHKIDDEKSRNAFHAKSKQKIQNINQSLSIQKQHIQQNIDDEKFRNALKQKKNEYQRCLRTYKSKVKQLFQDSKKKPNISSTINTQKFNRWQRVSQNSMVQIKNNPIQHRNVQRKIQNLDLFEQKTIHKIQLNEQKMVQSMYKSSQQGNKTNPNNSIVKYQKPKGIKNSFDEVKLGQNTKKQTEKTDPAVISQPGIKQKSVEQEQNSSSLDGIDLQQKSKINTQKHVQKQRSFSNVQLPAVSLIQPKVLPKNINTQIPNLGQIKQQLLPNKIKKRLEQNEKTVLETPKRKQSIDKKQEQSKQQDKKQIQKKQQQKRPQISLTQQMPLKALANPKQNFFDKVQQNIFNQAPSTQEYAYTNKILSPPKQNEPLQKEKQVQITIPKPPIKKDNKPRIKSSATKYGELNDEIQEISLGVKKEIPQPSTNQNNKPKKPQPIPNQKIQQQKQNKKVEQKEDPLKNREKTAQSNASSNGQRSVKKLIDQYIFMINKMGQAVAKTAKLSKKLQKVQWYVGVYFLYKRFYYQRKKIQKYLEQSIPKLTRYEQFNSQQWNQWLSKGQHYALLAKCKQDNTNIQNSLRKMVKKVQVKQLPSRVLLNANMNKDNFQSTKIAVEYVVDEYDQAVELNLLADPQIMTHLCQMVNSLYVIAQLDGKITEKKKLVEFTRLNRTKEELDHMVQVIFDLYEEMQQ